MILSAMDAAGTAPQFCGPAFERRGGARRGYRARGELRLYADPADAEPRTLYVRDADAHGLGFITPHLLPLGYGGWVTLLGPTGDPVRAECTVYRCRRAVQGWHEGALRFNREMWQFEDHAR